MRYAGEGCSLASGRVARSLPFAIRRVRPPEAPAAAAPTPPGTRLQPWSRTFPARIRTAAVGSFGTLPHGARPQPSVLRRAAQHRMRDGVPSVMTRGAARGRRIEAASPSVRERGVRPAPRCLSTSVAANRSNACFSTPSGDHCWHRESMRTNGVAHSLAERRDRLQTSTTVEREAECCGRRRQPSSSPRRCSKVTAAGVRGSGARGRCGGGLRRAHSSDGGRQRLARRARRRASIPRLHTSYCERPTAAAPPGPAANAGS
jgi:hypothetical protein